MNPRRRELRTRVPRVTLCGEAAAEALRLDVVDERTDAVDLDHREKRAVARLELLVAGDVDLAQVELELGTELDQLRPRPLAQVTALRVEEDDLRRYGYRPRVMVASATRSTASP
jgi:hypothetical protein